MTRTSRRLAELWAAHPASRTRHRAAELRRLVWRDLQTAARRARATARAGRVA